MALVCVVASLVAVAHRWPAAGSAEVLDGLDVIPRGSHDPGYRRTMFGGSWADLDGNGCNTRDDVLLATVDRTRSYRLQRQGRCRADMVAGTWTDLYTGTVMTWTDLKDTSQAEAIPIDHIVSLAGAYRYGAKDWTERRRIEFANDELNLTPTTREMNGAKADKDPSSWSPPPAGRCAYTTRYITVKARYRLPVDKQEKAALRRLLRGCTAS